MLTKYSLHYCFKMLNLLTYMYQVFFGFHFCSVFGVKHRWTMISVWRIRGNQSSEAETDTEMSVHVSSSSLHNRAFSYSRFRLTRHACMYVSFKSPKNYHHGVAVETCGTWGQHCYHCSMESNSVEVTVISCSTRHVYFRQLPKFFEIE